MLTHIPLARPEKTDCGPLRERGTIRQGVGWGYQNTLTEEATKFVLEELRPSAIFRYAFVIFVRTRPSITQPARIPNSGDDHDYCEYWHPIPGINGAKAKEISVKSFSMAMGVKVPGFQLLSLFPPSETNGQSFFDVPCFLPSQLGIYINVYVPFILMSLAALLVSNYYRVKASDQAQIYWSSAGDAGESGSVTNSYLDAGGMACDYPYHNGRFSVSSPLKKTQRPLERKRRRGSIQSSSSWLQHTSYLSKKNPHLFQIMVICSVWPTSTDDSG